jgi:PTH1 family peptidyl-tRNA hydrolase
MQVERNNIKSPFQNQYLPFLIVGLGNPGREYKNSRHNAGFMVVDRLAVQLDVSFNRVKSKALVTEARYSDHYCILAKPQTYMNLSGQSVSELMRFYKIPLSNLLVVHDDIDLPFGTIRLRPSGGSGGHKGMMSIIERLASQDFPRLRIGINRPPGRMEASDYVLQDFSPQEMQLLPEILDRAAQAVLTFLTEGIEQAMTRFNHNGG